MTGPKDQPEIEWAEDAQGERGFCALYRKLEEQSSGQDVVRLFERGAGAYYSVHGADARYVADTVYQTTTILKYLGETAKTEGLASCTLSRLHATTFLRRLLFTDLRRVEIWSNSQGGRSASGTWSICKRASPGNVQQLEGLLFGDSDVAAAAVTRAPVAVALKISSSGDRKLVGAAFSDALTAQRISVCEFVDTDTFHTLESFLIQLGAKEVLVAEGGMEAYEHGQLEAVAARTGVILTPCKAAAYTVKSLETDANLLLGSTLLTPTGTPRSPPITAMDVWDLRLAMPCLACLIHFLDLLADDSNVGQYQLERYDLSQYMRLDASAVKALNLFPAKGNSAGTMSLFGLFDAATRTSQGSRLLGQWLQQPLLSLPAIRTRQRLVGLLCRHGEVRQLLQEEHLKCFPDLHRLAKKFTRRTGASLEDVVRIYQCVVRLPILIECLEGVAPPDGVLLGADDDGAHMALDAEGDEAGDARAEEGPAAELALLRANCLAELHEHAAALQPFAELVETTIDLDAIAHHEFIIKPDFHDELREARAKMERVRATMEPEARRVAAELEVEYEKKLKFEHSPQFGYHMRMSRIEAHKMRGSRELLELSTQKAGVLFTTIRLKRASEEYEEWGGVYRKLQANLAKEILDVTATYAPVLEELNQLTPLGEGSIRLQRSRHPCLEVQEDVSFIENDVCMERGTSSFQIITGPNMGGKSTYIRQIGVMALLAQVGCYLPCASATLPLFDAILARVGAGDAQLKGISTFMAEMLETSAILRRATAHSLVIIDELGRGTSTSDGFGLAWAISEFIVRELDCYALFATHFHELTALADRHPQVQNCHVRAVAEAGAITLTYQVLPGVGDQSFGIHVAELAAFPGRVIRLSKRKADELECGGPDHPLWASTAAEVEEGTRRMQAFLAAFARPLDPEGGDAEEAMLARLEECVREPAFAAALQQDPFVREVLASL